MSNIDHCKAHWSLNGRHLWHLHFRSLEGYVVVCAGKGGEKIKAKICSLAIFLALATIIATASMVQAGQWWFDTQQGIYEEVQVCIAGTLMNMKLYNPAAYVKGTIDQNLPSPHTMIIYWYFEWEDLNYVVHTSTNVTVTSYTTAGQSQTIYATGLPRQVIYMYVEGKAGYDGIWDTPLASVGVPFN
jgi:hypothetical protein